VFEVGDTTWVGVLQRVRESSENFTVPGERSLCVWLCSYPTTGWWGNVLTTCRWIFVKFGLYVHCCSHPLCLCSPSSKIGSIPLKDWGGNCRPGRKYWQPTAGFMTHITCRLTAKNRDQLWNPTLGNRVWSEKS